jgi:hypothetical protein
MIQEHRNDRQHLIHTLFQGTNPLIAVATLLSPCGTSRRLRTPMTLVCQGFINSRGLPSVFVLILRNSRGDPSRHNIHQFVLGYLPQRKGEWDWWVAPTQNHFKIKREQLNATLFTTNTNFNFKERLQIAWYQPDYI